MRGPFVILRVGIIALVLGLGVAGMLMLKKFKKPPAQKEQGELRITAEAIKVQPRTVQAMLTGLGTAEARRRVEITPEVSGRIRYLNPRVEDGLRVMESELLFEVDPRKYQAAVDQWRAQVKAFEAQIENLRQTEKNDQRRLKVISRSRDLEQSEYERFKRLAEEEKVESQSRLEDVEQEMNRYEEQVVMLENTISLYPVRILELEAGLQSSLAQLEQAELNLEDTKVHAPFTGRIDRENLEPGQIVRPGMEPLLILIDDTVLEIMVPIEGGEAARWLDIAPAGDIKNWFRETSGLPVKIRWTEQPELVHWRGRLSRVERFDPKTRTLNLVVEVDEPIAVADDPGAQVFPLVEGMFCEVEIPGRTIEGVYRLPRSAVGPDGNVLVVNTERVHSRGVRIARYEGESVLIDAGLSPGDVVLTKQPGVVLDGTLADVSLINPQPRIAADPTSNSLKLDAPRPEIEPVP